MLGGPAGWKVSGRAHERDPPVLGRDGAVLNDPEPGPTGREHRKTRIEPYRVEPHGITTEPKRPANFSIHIFAQHCLGRAIWRRADCLPERRTRFATRVLFRLRSAAVWLD